MRHVSMAQAGDAVKGSGCRSCFRRLDVHHLSVGQIYDRCGQLAQLQDGIDIVLADRLQGMEPWSASLGSWTIERPPAFLISMSPDTPASPKPERRMPTTRSP